MSYDFDLWKEGLDHFGIRKDENDWEVLSRKLPPYYHQHIRRRIPKRYSDIVSPSSSRIFLSRKDSTNRDRHHLDDRSTTAHIHRHHSLKPINEMIYYFNPSKRKSRENVDHRYHQTIKHNDHLAHRMQAAMSSELMNSLDRNFVRTERRQLANRLLVPRSHSLNISTTKTRKAERKFSYHFIPRVKMNFRKENILIEEPTPDYDVKEEEEFIIRTIENTNDIDEEPTVDYEEGKPMINSEYEEKTITHSDQGASSSFIVPQTIDEQESIPPTPPPLLNLNTEQKTRGFRCRTIADKLSPDHKLILKDDENEEEKSRSPSERSPPHYIPVSKELTFQQISQTLSRSHSIHCPISLSNHTPKSSRIDDQGQSSPSPVQENDDEPRSSSSKIYQDYKKRTSSTTITRNHSMLMHPIHTRIGLRSSTSSSTNEKLSDMTLSGKQMNVCVINQLNEHLSTRFSEQKKQDLSANKKKTDRQSYDSPPELRSDDNPIQVNVYDEPSDLPMSNPIRLSSIPPPPPPLPVGGFRPIPSSGNRPSNSQRTSMMALPHEGNNSETHPCSAGTSTISSNLSDTRILRELRENPLFTRAKEHLEIEPGSSGRRSGRRLNGSSINLSSPNETNHETVSYLRLDTCSKSNLKKSFDSTIAKQSETIIMLPNELDGLIGKRTKSITNIHSIKSRSSIKSTSQTAYRQSELELIFQKRAQRSEQNLT